MHKKLTKQYGSIVRLQGLTAEDMVFLYDPAHIETVSFKVFLTFYKNEEALLRLAKKLLIIF